jgi:hypothetical protein
MLKSVEIHLKGQWQHGMHDPKFKNDVSDVIRYLVDKTWLFASGGRLVKASEISRCELDPIYDANNDDSEIYDILGFEKTEQETKEELLSGFDLQYSKQDKLIILKQLLNDRQLVEAFQVKDEDDEFDPDIDVPGESFPEEPIPPDLERLRKQTTDNYRNARNVEYKPLLRRIRTSRDNDRDHIRHRYMGFCQICKNQNSYWEVAEIFKNPQKEMKEMNLSLCPNCASMYRQVRNDEEKMASFADELRQASPKTNATVQLGDEDAAIRFTQAHLAEIQVILDLDKPIPSQNDEMEN